MKAKATREAQIAASVVDFVRNVLDKYPKTRENDQALLLAVWHEQGLRLRKDQIAWILTKGMKAERVRGARKEIYARGYWPQSAQAELFAHAPEPVSEQAAHDACDHDGEGLASH